MANFMDKIKKMFLGTRKNITLPVGSQVLSFRPCESIMKLKTLEGWSVVS